MVRTGVRYYQYDSYAETVFYIFPGNPERLRDGSWIDYGPGAIEVHVCVQKDVKDAFLARIESDLGPATIQSLRSRL